MRDYRKKYSSKNKRKFNLKLNISRRIFCHNVFTATLASFILNSCGKIFNNKMPAEPEDKWQTISSIYEHMLPKDNIGPDSVEINATNYLKKILNKSSTFKRIIINEGIVAVNKLSLNLFSKNFTELNFEQKEKILREIEKETRGEKFLTYLLEDSFEAMLGDPIYGCQPNYAGWRWLEHIPGFPRPNKPNAKVI